MDMNDIQDWAKRAGGQQDDDSGEADGGGEDQGSEPMDLKDAEGQLKAVLDGLKAHGTDGPDLSKVTSELEEVLEMLQEAMGEDDSGEGSDEESGDDEGSDEESSDEESGE